MKNIKKISIILAAVVAVLAVVVLLLGFNSNDANAVSKVLLDSTAAVEGEAAVANSDSAKAIGAAIVVGLAALGGTIAMGLAISKSSESISRQPEAEGKIRTTLMLGLVFIETVVIYALIVAILLIFVL